MKWLKQFKEIVDNNPDVSDLDLFRSFPELKGRQDLLSAAFLYWRYEIVAEEFIKEPIWKRIVKYILNGIGRYCRRTTAGGQ